MKEIDEVRQLEIGNLWEDYKKYLFEFSYARPDWCKTKVDIVENAVDTFIGWARVHYPEIKLTRDERYSIMIDAIDYVIDLMEEI